MSEFKGTPGPWKWNDRYLGLKNRELKRDVFHFEPYEGLALRPYGDSQEAKTERAANARLIAAAPDLLEVLQEFMDHGEQAFGHDFDVMIKARTVIAKALTPNN